MHRLRVVGLALLAIACTPASPQPASAPAAAPDADTSKQASAPEAKPTDGDWYIGVLGQRGEPDCPKGEQTWIDVEPTIGWTPTQPLGAEESVLLDQPVVAHGLAGEPPVARVATTVTAPCPPPQARSDWRFTPRGLRIYRSGGGRAPFFVRDSLRPLAELALHADGEQLVVDFRNPVPVELTDVALRIHYEGCHGKPGTLMREHPVGTLATGAGTQATFAAIEVGDRGAHRAYSVQVIAKGERVTFDLDVPVGRLGVPVECPDRGK
jgi:hypothetical protein